jgi:hypothetical protein
MLPSWSSLAFSPLPLGEGQGAGAKHARELEEKIAANMAELLEA